MRPLVLEIRSLWSRLRSECWYLPVVTEPRPKGAVADNRTSPKSLIAPRLLPLLLLAGGTLGAETYSYWVQPCSDEMARRSACEAADVELAQWALEAWQSAAGEKLSFARTEQERQGRIRIYWVAGVNGMYGEARPIVVDGKLGAAVFVLPDLAQLGPEIAAAGRKDRLFRHAVVYLTCLHESGHAIGLSHTAAYKDIMYSFGHGGDILEYFSRYRRQLGSRADIRKHSGISPADQKRLRATLVADN